MKALLILEENFRKIELETFPAVRHSARKLELVPDILWAMVDNIRITLLPSLFLFSNRDFTIQFSVSSTHNLGFKITLLKALTTSMVLLQMHSLRPNMNLLDQ